MIYYLTHIKDNIGSNYLGIDIPISIAEPFLNELKDLIGEDDFDKYTQLQKNRDHGNYHITTINVMEYNSLSKEMGIDKFVTSLDPIFKYGIDDIKMLGLGTGERNGNRAYFIVCESDKLDSVRSRYGLPKQDFHITLGFLHKDVFGVRKNEVLKKNSKFLKLLSNDYYKNNNWNFLKRIGNFNLNPDLEIIPISITDDKIKVKCDGYYMEIFLLDDERYWISSQYILDEELPRLPETEISRVLNEK